MGSINKIKELIGNNKREIRKIDNDGNTKLHLLVKYHCLNDYIDYLKRIIREININHRNNMGETPLITLIKYSNVSNDPNVKILTRIFVDSGADMNIQDVDGRTALIYACKNNNIEIAKILLSKGANTNIQDCDGKNALMHCCTLTNNNDIMDLLLDSLVDDKPDLTLSDIYGKTIFMHLAHTKKPYIDHPIFRDLPDPSVLDSKDDKGMTALMHACINSSIDMVSYIANHNININSQDFTGKTALMYACMNNSNYALDIMQLLINRCVDLNIQDSNGMTCLMYACMNNSNYALDIIQLLIHRNVDFNIQDSNGITCLMYASLNKSKNRALIVDTILTVANDRVDVDKQDLNGMTALMHACISNNIDAVYSLVIKTKDINIKDNKGMTALMYASLYDNLDIVENLLRKGADASLQDMNGRTALMHAIRSSTIDPNDIDIDIDIDTCTIVLLLSKKVRNSYILSKKVSNLYTVSIKFDPNINAQDINGKTALFYAIKTCDKRIVKMLLRSKELNLEVKDIKGRTVLIYTSQVKSIISTKIIKMLLSKKPDINASDNSGKNALMYACINEDLEKVKILLKCNPDINKKDNDGYTALMHAFKIDQNSYVKKKIINKLLKKGADIVVKDSNYNSSLIEACKSSCDFDIINRIVETLDKISDDECKILEEYINNKMEVIKNEIKNINSKIVKKKCNITKVTQNDN
jgi:ankyrin repeat protein